MAASSADQSPVDQPSADQPTADRPPGEKRKMTVSERSVGDLATALQDWLASRPGAPGQPTVSGVRHARQRRPVEHVGAVRGQLAGRHR